MPSIKALEDLKEIIKLPDSRKGKPVYLQENGDLLGKVTSIKDETLTVESDGVELEFSQENIIEGDAGLVYSPEWFTKAERVVKELKKREEISHELSEDAQLRSLVSEAEEVLPTLISKRTSLEERNQELKQKISDKMDAREHGDLGRREVMVQVADLNREWKIVETNLKRVEELINELRDSTFIDSDKTLKDPEEENNMMESKDEMSEQPVSSRNPEGERIKKLRILKLEKNLEEQQKKVAQSYIRDRLQRVTQDKKDLKKLREENKDNERTVELLDQKIVSLTEEQEELREKLKDIRQGDIENIQKKEPEDDLKEDLPETKVVEDTSNEVFGLDTETITRIGLLLTIFGVIIVLVISLIGMI